MKRDDLAGYLSDCIHRGLEAGPDPTEWRRSLDYYHGRPRGDELAGQPAVQSLDVADMVHAIQAQILPTFAGDALCTFEPDGQGDEHQARLESDATNRVMMESSRGYVVLYEAIKDALLLKNGLIKVWLDETTETTTQNFGEISPEQRNLILNSAGPDEELELVEADDGFKVKRTAKQRRVRMAAVDPLNFVVDGYHDTILLQDVRFCGERKLVTREELEEMGATELQASKATAWAASSHSTTDASLRFRSGTMPAATARIDDQDIVEVWECYVRLEGELSRVLLCGQEIISEEVVDYVPYAAGSAFLEAHRFWGLSIYDRLKTVQDAKTMTLRQWLANLAGGNLNRTAANDSVTMDDLVSGRTNGVIRVRGVGPVAESLMPFPYVDTGGSSASMLGYMDQVRADRGGAALQMANSEAQLVGAQVGSAGVDRIFSVQEQLAGWIARTMAETLLRSAFELVHRCLRLEYARPIELQLADQWVTTDPRGWKSRDRVNIKAGLSAGERARKAAAMLNVVQIQTQALQLGADGVLVDLNNLYSAYLDWAAAAEIDGANRYWVDPRGQAAQQAAAQKGEQAKQEKELAMQLQQAQLQLAQGQLQNEQLKLRLDKEKSDAELAFKYRNASLSAEIEEAKLTAKVTADLQLAEQSARDAADAVDARSGSVGERAVA